MRVLIILAKYLYPSRRPEPELFPQGPAYVAGALKAAGHEVFGVNIAYLESVLPWDAVLKSRIAAALSEYQPELIAVGGLSGDYPFVKDAVQACRDLCPAIPVVMGGGIVSADPDFIFARLRPDFAIVGEAEEPIVRLVAALEGKDDVRSIPGVWFWERGEARFNPLPRPSKEPLRVPYPYYDPLGIEEFFRASSHRNAWHLSSFSTWPRMFPVSAARACPFRCTFCWHSAGSVYRQRPVADVIEEVIYFHEKYRFNMLVVYDELFGLRESRVREFCERIRATRLGLDWSVCLRVPDVTLDMLREMRASGCKLIGFGLESASDEVLRSMKKRITRAQIERAFALAEQAGIGVQGCFIFGDPAETLDTIEETTNFIKQHADLCLRPTRVAPYPGAAIFAAGMRKGVIRDRATYYESIAGARRYNLTDIPDADFFDRTEEVFQLDLVIRERARVQREVFALREEREYGPDELPRWYVLIKAECPRCRAAADYNFDVCFAEQDATPLVRTLREEHPVLCRECSKLMVIALTGKVSVAALSIPPGDTPTYDELRRSLRALRDGTEKATVATSVGLRGSA